VFFVPLWSLNFMERKYFALEPGGPPRIGVIYEMIGGEFIVTFDKRQTRPGTREELAAGKWYRTPDGIRLWIQSQPPEPAPVSEDDEEEGRPPRRPVPQVQVLRDGEPLPEVQSVIPHEHIRHAASLLLLVGALDMFLGFWLMRLITASAPGIPRPFITGIVFLFCGWSLWRQKMGAARLGIIVAGLDLVISLTMAFGGGGSGVLFTVIARSLVIWALLRALESYRRLLDARHAASLTA
jgi:hypothetical protein